MISSRVLPLSSVHNFRDYGGYAVAGGAKVKSGLLWRSAHHQDASDADLEAIDALNLTTVVDLRGDPEREAHPCRRSSNFKAQVLFAGGATAGLAPHLAAAKEGIDAATVYDRMIDTYTDMPYRPALVATMRMYFSALSQQDSASLVHCVAGKDRTGWTVAVLHNLLGVQEDDVMEDYLLTNSAGNIEARIAQGASHLRDRYAWEISDDAVRTMMSVEPEYLRAALRAVGASHNSIEAYAEDVLGVDTIMREQLRERLID